MWCSPLLSSHCHPMWWRDTLSHSQHASLTVLRLPAPCPPPSRPLLPLVYGPSGGRLEQERDMHQQPDGDGLYRQEEWHGQEAGEQARNDANTERVSSTGMQYSPGKLISGPTGEAASRAKWRQRCCSVKQRDSRTDKTKSERLVSHVQHLLRQYNSRVRNCRHRATAR